MSRSRHSSLREPGWVKRLTVAWGLAFALLTVHFATGAVPVHALTCQSTLQQPDSSGYIWFYHGTAQVYAQDIAANGIDLSKSSPNTDFGRGFYITTNEYQAEEWAWKNFPFGIPTVVVYRVPYQYLTPSWLCGQVFSSANTAYQNFVRNMRANQPPIGGGGYDFVEGPLLLNVRQFLGGAAPIMGGQQDSIHTSFAVSLFNSSFDYTFPAPTLVPFTLRSVASGQYVSAEQGYTGANYGMLRARASGQGPWEQYNIFRYADTDFGFYSTANYYYVSAELGYTGGNYAMLRARANSRGPWEQYRMIENSDGTMSLLSLANGLYVSAELGYTGGNYGMLRARASAIGPWETFTDNTSSTNCSCE